ncbi:MAG: amino acid transporter ATP-binding protein [Devosia sp.]|uniref:amino acid ABC transporter ATP-binding protein n=1 Tax=Devosia sp. TaxID=1871048 RepID=UPI00260183C0|nr:amino acid ABC transporter ATP-binding protein [Devosia sp.]MDB5529856.1 amino acid transporter ATP-binding protein [Devosia sp.]
MTIPALRTEAIAKSFNGNEVLSGIDLSIMPGEVVCIVGPSGSGKSTFLRCINHLSPATSGHVYLNGELFGERETAGGNVMPLQHAALQEQRQRIGMVFQSFNLWPHRTALENVMEGPRIVKKMPTAEARDLAESLLERVGLAERKSYYPGHLSGGQQQRVAIARALAMQPELILFDEPTSALDPELVGEVLSVMKELASGETTMIVVTHEIGFAVEVADRLVLMDKGRIVEDAPPRQFIEAPREERSRQFLKQVLSRSLGFSGEPSGAILPLSILQN